MAQNADPISPWLVALIAVVLGVLSSEIAMYLDPPAFGRQIGVRYMNLAWAAACVFAFVAGYLGPRRPWRWCLAIAWSHAFWILFFRPYDVQRDIWKTNHIREVFGVILDPRAFWLIALILLTATIFSLIGMPFAYAGAWLRRRLQGG